MKIHEYQARELLEKAGIPVPDAIVVDTPAEARDAFEKLVKDGATLAVVKAQVHAGGRGKGGGVKLVKTADDAEEAAKTILSKPLVTHQTGPEGVPVNKLLVASGVDIDKEYYLGMAVDRGTGRPVMIASSEGGMDIEEVAEKTPELIFREPLSAGVGLHPYQARKIAYTLGFKGKQIGQAAKIMGQLADLFIGHDADLVEINPLIVTPASDDFPDGQVLAIDAKISFDSNALFRQKDLVAMHDPTEEPESERKANQYGLSYIQLDGTIGCLVNGAGLAMATMDLIKLHGGEPANFLDVGGSATEEAVTEAFRIILADEKVEGVLVNIFGGIAKCDTIANAIVTAAKEVGFKVPLVVRLEGNRVEIAREIMEKAAADIPMLVSANGLNDAAEKITAQVAAAV